MNLPSETYQRIYAVVAQVPRGKVATYGQIARLAAMPRHARLVGYALHALAAGNRLPWHRVVNAKGMISERGDDGVAAHRQRQRLEREGVRFDARGAIPLKEYLWQPD
ncbi:MAG TPA: MGMT family protein [Rhodocyclaceae bacterium]|jgi:methylated-DNA-protein-cysteine methyltransferase-like protein|nr:MGMT family protein [Rhodocyclaceae bacterium]